MLIFKISGFFHVDYHLGNKNVFTTYSLFLFDLYTNLSISIELFLTRERERVSLTFRYPVVLQSLEQIEFLCNSTQPIPIFVFSLTEPEDSTVEEVQLSSSSKRKQTFLEYWLQKYK